MATISVLTQQTSPKNFPLPPPSPVDFRHNIRIFYPKIMVLNTSFFITLYSETHESLTKLPLQNSSSHLNSIFLSRPPKALAEASNLSHQSHSKSLLFLTLSLSHLSIQFSFLTSFPSKNPIEEAVLSSIHFSLKLDFALL